MSKGSQAVTDPNLHHVVEMQDVSPVAAEMQDVVPLQTRGEIEMASTPIPPLEGISRGMTSDGCEECV